MIKHLAQRFFQWFCDPEYYTEIQGDLEEIYQRNLKKGANKAQWKYLFQVLGLFRPSLMRSFLQYHLTHPAMFKSYFTISTRILLRHKFYSAINILGLAVGLGVCLLIYQYIHFELSYDGFHADAQNIYRLTQTTIRNGENQGTGVYTTYGLGPRGKERIPEIEDVVRIRPQETAPIIINPENKEVFLEDGLSYVDSNFLQMFNFPLIYGERELALGEKHSIVITEQMAIKYFGDTNPVGKALKISLGVFSGDFIVTAVLKTLPVNSHLQFNFLIPMAFLLEKDGFYKRHDSEGWEMSDFVTYVRLNKAAELDHVGEKFYQLITTYTKRNVEDSNTEWKIGFQPIADIHLRSDFPRDFVSNDGDIQNVQVFSVIAIFILFMAWVNYINLSTARAKHRAKEVGVRKTIGAIRKQLVGQFMIESALINFIAAMLSIGIAYCMLPVLNNIIGKALAFNVLRNLDFWAWFIGIIVLGSILSGLYPAVVLSSFKPIHALKSVKITQKGGLSLRRGLILFQFLMSVLLISGTYLVYQQITFMKNQDLGIDMKKILVVKGARVVLESLKSEGVTLGSKYQAFKNKVVAYHAISGVAFTSPVPGKGYYGTGGFWKVGNPESTVQEGNIIVVDTGFANTYDLNFLAKDLLIKEFSPDEKVIINNEAVKVFGFGSPEEALHEKLTNGGDTLEILGVVKNVYWSSLKDAQSPMLFVLNNEYGEYFSIKMNLSDIRETISYIASAYYSVFPDDPFHYFFLDDAFNHQYQSDLQFRNLFSAFSILAIFIACLGLFALVSYSATLRVKEIGIRKVFGASISHLMVLLSKEYLVLLCIAILLAVPAILIGGKAWLENYAYKVGIGLDLFLIPGLVLVIISFLTVGYRTYASARANPVESLRAE